MKAAFPESRLLFSWAASRSAHTQLEHLVLKGVLLQALAPTRHFAARHELRRRGPPSWCQLRGPGARQLGDHESSISAGAAEHGERCKSSCALERRADYTMPRPCRITAKVIAELRSDLLPGL